LRAKPESASVPRVTQILVIEDDRANADLFRQVLGEEGYELQCVERLELTPADATPDLVIADLVGLDRYESEHARRSIQRVQARFRATPVIVCTAYEQALEESDRLGAAAVLHKPFNIAALVETVARVVAD
jgi:CheY-like chemotaxis protein